MLQKINIIADYREKSSGIPDLLVRKGANVEIRELKSGDYFINGQILAERKTKEDFVQSLVSNRLFSQCQRMRRSADYQLFIVEGNPYETKHNINAQAIKGALLSLSVSWQIPVFFTKDVPDTANVIIMAARQMLQEKIPVSRTGYKPKRNKSRKLYFIQGLPAVGPVLASRLLERFGSIEQIVHASQSDLLEIEGIGKKKAVKIIEFIRN